MKRFSAGAYPQLRAFARGYLHQDFAAESGSPAGALAAFRRDASPEQLRALAAEFGAFMDAIAHVSFDQARTWWTRDLGAAWVPKDKGELAQLGSGLQDVSTKRP